jgi:hypothetical protein
MAEVGARVLGKWNERVKGLLRNLSILELSCHPHSQQLAGDSCVPERKRYY